MPPERLLARRCSDATGALPMLLLMLGLPMTLASCGESVASERAERRISPAELAGHSDPATWAVAAAIGNTGSDDAPGLPRRVDPRTGITFVRIPAGEFHQGPADNPRLVRITTPFWLAETELTVAQWRRYIAQLGGDALVPVADGDDLPMSLSWQDAVEFCRRLGYRLPTEAEWERACRADHEPSNAPWRTPELVRQHSWFNATAGEGARPVGTRTPNGFGLYDMLGNVWEWCSDWSGEVPFGADRTGQPSGGVLDDPTGPAHGEGRVLRGASWFTIGNPTPLARTQDYPFARTVAYGLRPARSL